MQTVLLIILIAMLGVIANNQLSNFDSLAKVVSSNKTLSNELDNLDQTQVIVSTAFDLGAVAYQGGQSCPANTQRWTHSSGVTMCVPMDSLCTTTTSTRVPCLITGMALQSNWTVSFLSLLVPQAHAQTMPTIQMNAPTCNGSSDPDCVNCNSGTVTCLTIPLCRVHTTNCSSKDRFSQTFALPVPAAALYL